MHRILCIEILHIEIMSTEVLSIEILRMKKIWKDERWDEGPHCTVHVVNVVTKVRIEICGKYGSHHVLLLRITCTEGTAVAQWLRCCATDRKVGGSIPAGVSGIFH